MKPIDDSTSPRWLITATRIIASIVFFIIGLDGAAGLNRWWLGTEAAFQENLLKMVIGFLIFSSLASRSKTDFLGFLLLSAAIYYVLDYEIGGPSKIYLTPFDPLLGLTPVFERGRWMGMVSIEYRLNMIIAFTILACVVLAFSKSVRRRAENHPASHS